LGPLPRCPSEAGAATGHGVEHETVAEPVEQVALGTHGMGPAEPEAVIEHAVLSFGVVAPPIELPCSQRRWVGWTGAARPG